MNMRWYVFASLILSMLVAQSDGQISFKWLPVDQVRSSWSSAINEKGQIVGHFNSSDDRLFRWDPDGSVTRIDPIHVDSQGASLSDINDFGVMVGSSSPGTFLRQGAIWPVDGPPIVFPVNSALGAVNNAGNVVGATWDDPLGVVQGILWNQMSGSVSMGTMDFRPGEINEANLVAGTSISDGGPSRGYLWSPETGFQLMSGTLESHEAVHISGLNERGNVVGRIRGDRGDDFAYIWTPQEQYVRLPVNSRDSGALGTNDLNYVVGHDGQEAIVWTPDRKRVSLNGFVPSSWNLEYAYDINNELQIVARSRSRHANGSCCHFQVVRLQIPELKTVALSGGWEAIVPAGVSSIVDVGTEVVDGQLVQFVEISSELTEDLLVSPGYYATVPITFRQTSESAAEFIAIDSNTVTNATNEAWPWYHLLLTDDHGARFDPARSARVSHAPFAAGSFRLGDTRFDLFGGLVSNGTTWSVGGDDEGGRLWVDVNPGAIGEFAELTLLQRPAPEPSSVALFAIGLCCFGVLRRGR